MRRANGNPVAALVVARLDYRVAWRAQSRMSAYMSRVVRYWRGGDDCVLRGVHDLTEPTGLGRPGEPTRVFPGMAHRLRS